jgi:hypothetical protein
MKWWMFPFLLIIVIPCLIIDHFSESILFCEFWGWHMRPNVIGNDGCSNNGRCPRCDKHVLQDSQGNWF